MIHQIFKICWNQKSVNLWIWLEMIVVSVILWVNVDTIYFLTSDYFKPLGHDITHTYRVNFNSASEENPTNEMTVGEKILAISDRVRNYKGVETLSFSFSSMPYSTMDNYSYLASDTSRVEESDFMAQRRTVTPDFFRVFRCMDAEGKTETLTNALLEENKIIVNSVIANKLYPNENSVGKKIFMNKSPHIWETGVSAVIPIYRTSEYSPINSHATYFNLLPQQAIAGINETGWIEAIVRVSPEADHDFPERIKRELGSALQYENVFVIDFTSMSEIREMVIFGIGGRELSQKGIIAGFLLINIFLGIAGTFWYRTRQRQNEMGLRMAMGSTHANLQRMMTGEGMVLLALATLPAMIIALNLGWIEFIPVSKGRMLFTPERFLICQAITVGLMALMVLVGIVFPARSIARLHPSDALRCE